ncbi:hypothetical protein KFE25_005971 [Diacronema lutheri]|nr:hypothetical protein KFE25_005971 [Diacronema lutheri]
MLPQHHVEEAASLFGGQLPVSTLSLAWLRTTLWDNVRAIYTSNRARTLILGRSFLNPLKFSRPVDQGEALMRLRANWGTYKPFYGLIYFFFLLYTILSSPLLLLGLFSIGGSWAYLFVLHDAPAVVKVGGYELGRREKLLTLIPGTIIMVAVTGALSSLVWVLFISSLVALPHAVTHEKPELDALDQLELEGAHLGEPRPMHSGLG